MTIITDPVANLSVDFFGAWLELDCFGAPRTYNPKVEFAVRRVGGIFSASIIVYDKFDRIKRTANGTLVEIGENLPLSAFVRIGISPIC